ncbi:hypothetical protein ACHAW5_005454 [Stephanodiscus triporus]|uniref:Uncharacterized protein n=1 Tax=Stephanodiscus triporus TaxID=2934178 RepID=A0ABD3QGD3_9STRA
MGSGTFDLEQKIMVKMFQKKTRLADMMTALHQCLWDHPPSRSSPNTSLQETLSGQMQHDYMGSRTKYRGLCKVIRKGFWLGDDGAPTSIKVTSKYLNHSVLTLGYKLEEFAQIPKSDKLLLNVHYRPQAIQPLFGKGGFVDSAINAKFPCLSADHSHAQFFRDVDILFHDTQYLYSEYSPESGAMSKEFWGHSTELEKAVW